ncbi:MAG: hypothetical protein PHS59_03455 [Paludibacter sp.]|nr:hypothetical protein [Paludibacter sp.]
MNNYKIENTCTQNKMNYLFGFHDICAWNSSNNRLVALEVDDITLPPDPTISYNLGYIDNANNFIKVGTTHAFNYPQGARQQWIYNSYDVIVNDIENNRIVSKIYNTDTCQLVDTLNDSTHVITNDGWAFGLDYARLFRLGAYGYAGVEDDTKGDDTPDHSGIVKHNIYSKERQILLSVKEIANFKMDSKSGKHHYITHLVLSPDQKRIAFLHRYKLSDGGETTRLCTIGADGKDLRCLATGFLSHFDWADNQQVMIWGRTGSNVEKLRASLIYRLIPTKLLQIAKKTIKTILKSRSDKPEASSFHWNCISDELTPIITFIGEGILTEDGHPMFCPTNRNWFICDNYPDKEGIRTLFLYSLIDNKRIDLGRFKMIDTKPDLSRSADLLKEIDAGIMKIVGLSNMAFTRSGLHCDLHPRWSPNGKKVSFDSIHEGTRQIYTIDVTQIIK